MQLVIIVLMVMVVAVAHVAVAQVAVVLEVEAVAVDHEKSIIADPHVCHCNISGRGNIAVDFFCRIWEMRLFLDSTFDRSVDGRVYGGFGKNLFRFPW